MVDHPVVETVEDGVPVDKGEFRSTFVDGVRFRVASADEVRSGDFSTWPLLDVGGFNYDRDTSDTTSPDTGGVIPDVLVDAAGTRFKLKSSNRTAFRATKSSGQMVPGNTLTKLEYSNVASWGWDYGGYYDAPNSQWVPRAGTYLIRAQIYVASGLVVGQYADMRILVDGVTMVRSVTRTTTTGAETFYVSGTVTVDGTQSIAAHVQINGAGDKDVVANAQVAFFEGQTIGADGKPGDPGPEGEPGEEGPPGPPNTLTIGTVVDGDEADATITGDAPNQVLNLTLPRGEQGVPGDEGPPGPAGGLQSVLAGDNITIDDTDPENPVISATGGGGGFVMVPFSFTGDGTTGPFTLPAEPAPDTYALLYFTGVAQVYTDDYTVTGDQLSTTSNTVTGLTYHGFVFALPE